MDTIFNQDPTGILNEVVIIVKTVSGSTYVITLTGPTISAKQGDILVRKCTYFCTSRRGKTMIVLDEYVGVSRDATPHLLFVSDVSEEEESFEQFERTRVRLPMSSALRPEELKLDISSSPLAA